MTHRNSHRLEQHAERTFARAFATAVDGTAVVERFALVLVLVLLITSGGAG
jgi:hypothetical protein